MISEIQSKYIKKEISVLELISEYLNRIKSFNKKLNSFITVSEKYAIDKAKECDEILRSSDIKELFNKYPLFGIPVAHKDIYSTEGIRTTAASNILNNYIPPYNATSVVRLIDAGSIIIGKTNCDAFAHGATGENSDFGPTKNPYNLDYVAGGSSSGSAVAVAADLCVIATGTDTGGSIRTPASHTNIVGLKPTYGRVSRYGIIAMASSTDSIGHMTKTIEDNAKVLQITAGYDPLDATSSSVPVDEYENLSNKSIKGLRIGIPKEFVHTSLNTEIRSVLERGINLLKSQGALIKEISLPHTSYGIAVYYIIQPSEVSSNLARFDGIRYGYSRETFGKEAKRRIMIGTFVLSAGYKDAYYTKAQNVRKLITNDFTEAFKRVDVICTPVSPTLTPKLGEKINDPLETYLLDAFMVSANLAGIPALSVPAGFSKTGLPIGIQCMGKHFDEKTLFRVANVLETEIMAYKRKPEL
jgi:aspartyl-tRNA(Asn)/glutamyl-tRNA(Gln) amidotransferase subunit A